MSNSSLEALNIALQKSWSAETSSSDKWDTINPSLGQCTVTACVLQDYLGGDMVNSIATLPDGKKVSHYLNLIDGEYIDLTAKQFPKGTTFSKPNPKTKDLPTTREYCLSFKNTNDRYIILKNRVAQIVD